MLNVLSILKALPMIPCEKKCLLTPKKISSKNGCVLKKIDISQTSLLVAIQAVFLFSYKFSL